MSLIKIFVTIIILALNTFAQNFNPSDSLKYSYVNYHQQEVDSLKGQKYFVNFSFTYPEIFNKEIINDSVEHFVFHTTESPQNVSEYFAKIIKSYKDYLEKEADYISSYSEERDVKIIFNQDNIVSLRLIEYTYNGGIHGQTTKYFKCFNINESKQIKLSDLFSKDNYSRLSEIAEDEFYNQLSLSKTKDLKQQGFLFKDDKFKLNNNFYIDTVGLHFYYNTYEIRAYAYGPTDLLIPWSKIKHILKENVIKGI